jgi:hypothetical protein
MYFYTLLYHAVGNLVLAVKETFFSNNVLSFSLMALFILFCFLLMFRMMIGDSRLGWFGFTSGILPLLSFFISGEHDPDFYYLEDRDWSSFVYVLFLLIIMLFFLNLFIAVLNSVWEKNIVCIDFVHHHRTTLLTYYVNTSFLIIHIHIHTLALLHVRRYRYGTLR